VSGDSGVGGPAEIYDPATSTWRTTSPMLLADAVMSAVLLPDGRVFSGCGDAPGNFELYSPHATLVRRLGLGLWRMAAPAPVVLHRCALSLLPDGRVLVAGGVPTGVDSSPVASAYIYDPVTDAWTGAGSMNAPRAYGVATALADGRVLVSGGTDANLSVFDGTEIYDPASDEWALATATPSLQLARTCCVTTTLLADGTVLIAGGTGFPNSPDYPEDLAEAEIIRP